jgi:hypothetical protein
MNLEAGEQLFCVRFIDRPQPGDCFFSNRIAPASSFHNRWFFGRNWIRVAKVLVFAAILLSSLARGAELIFNGGFESGSSSWSLQEATVTSSGGYAHSGTSYLQIFPAPYAGHQGIAYQTINVPPGVTAATLSFYWNVSLVDNNVVVNDSMTVLLRDPVIIGVLTNFAYYYSASKSAPGNPNYHLAQFSLVPFAGRSVRLDFMTANNPVSGETVFRIDDVSVVTSTAPCACALSATNNNPSTPESGSGSFNIFSTNSACLWVASASPWIHTSNRGTGNGTINYTYDANNTALPRTGSISVLGYVFSITQPGLLAAPISLTPTNGATGASVTPTLAWSPVIGATRYRLMLATNSGKLPLDVYAGTCTNCPPSGFVGGMYDTNYTAPDPFPVGGSSTHVLKHGTKYYWKVQAWNDSGFAGVYSIVNSFTTAPVASPVIKALNFAGSAFSVTIPTEVGVNYFLERKQSLSDATWVSVQSASGNGNDLVLTDSSATGITEVYRVRANEPP